MNTQTLDKIGASTAAETAIGLTQEMVRIDSTNGKEDALARDLERRLKSLKVGKVWCEKTYEGRLNTLWEVDSGKSGPSLLFTGHLDTKPVCEGWQRDPFDGAIEKGRLFGHGVMDMKAGLGSLVGGIMTMVDSGVDFKGKITFCGGRRPYGQQTGSIDLFRRHKFDHCVLAELTDMQIYIAHRGRYYFDISTIGRSAHTCHKYKAINAIEKMLPVVEEISKLKYFPNISQEMKDLVGPELLHRGRPHLRRAVSRRPLDDPRPLHHPRRYPAAARRADRRGQGVFSGRSSAPRRAIRKSGSRSSMRTSKNSFMVVRRTDGRALKASGRRSWARRRPPRRLVARRHRELRQLCETVIFGPGGEPVYQPNESLAITTSKRRRGFTPSRQPRFCRQAKPRRRQRESAKKPDDHCFRWGQASCPLGGKRRTVDLCPRVFR